MADVVVIGGKKVLVCKHCDGSTQCKNAAWSRGQDGMQVLRCSRCGPGVARIVGETFSGQKKYESSFPVCAPCGGSGYIAL